MSDDPDALAGGLGARVREARLACGLTQDEVADRIGVSTTHYDRIERGTSLPNLVQFWRIARELSVSADKLLDTWPPTDHEPGNPRPG